jgi:hypothetical protein
VVAFDFETSKCLAPVDAANPDPVATLARRVKAAERAHSKSFVER